MAAKIIKNYELRFTSYEVVSRRGNLKRGVFPKSFILWGRFAKRPYNVTKSDCYQGNQLCQSVKLWQSVATKIRF